MRWSVETTEQFLARGGKIEEVPQGKSGEWQANAPLTERISRQKKRAWNRRKDRLHKQVKG
jgi:hypothetical protein